MNVFVVSEAGASREKLLAHLAGDSRFQVRCESPGPDLVWRSEPANDPQVVILDCVNGESCGLDMVRRIKQESPAIRVVMLVEHCHPQYVRMCRHAGADYVFHRDDDIGRLRQLMQDVAD